MADSKSSMGLWSNMHQSVVNIKQDLLGIGSVVQSQVIPQLQKMSDLLKNSSRGVAGKSGGANSVADNGASKDGSTGPSSNKVADNGVPEDVDKKFASVNRMANEANSIADNGAPPPNDNKGGLYSSFGGGALGKILPAGLLTAADKLQQFLPGTNTAVLQDLYTQRSAFYGQGGYTGSLQDQTGRVRSLQKSMANNGVAIDTMDSTRALAYAQQSGLTGTNNFNQVMQGAAQASNFVPGMGLSAVTQAVGGVFNSANTVNMAKTIGLNIRDANGNMLPLPQLVDKIWNYLKTTSGPSGLNKKDMEFSFQPGYGLYNMVNGLVGGDPSAFELVKNMLLAKAQIGGKPLANMTQDQMVKAGIMSATTRNIAQETAAKTGVLVSTSAAQAGGAAGAADVGTGMNRLAAAMSDLISVFSGLTGFLSGLGNLGSQKKASGGTVGGHTPYIVGEIGPELFVPKTDGVIVPNSMLGLNRATGGGVKAGGGGPSEVYNFLLKNGLSPSGATGVIGNLMAESNVRPTAVGDQGTSGGIAQWHNGRWTALNTYAKQHNLQANTLKAQEQFLVYEMKNKYPGLWKSLSNKGISEGNAAALVMQQYERPADQSQAAAEKRANLGVKAISGKWDPKVSVTSGAAPTTTDGAASPITGWGNVNGSSLSDLQAAARERFANAASGASGGTNLTNYHFGNVTISVSGTSDAKAVAVEVAKQIKTLGKK